MNTSAVIPPSAAARLSQRLLGWCVAHLWYRTALHGDVPARGPAVIASLHRCGAVDGWVEHGAIGGDMAFLVGANLRRNPLTRLLAVGIPVERSKDDRDRSGNAAALECAARWVAAGGRLVVYPEGTSDLGPKPLPFHPGAARIVSRVLELGVVPSLVPMAVDYDRPGVPGSQVDVVAGPVVPLSPDDGTVAVHRKLSGALGALAFPFADEDEQRRARHRASVLARGDRRARMGLLRGSAEGPHGSLPAPARPSVAALAAFWVGAAANAPLALVAWLAPRRLADAANVVPFWRLVPLVFATPAWLAAVGIAGWVVRGPAGLLAAPVAAALGLVAVAASPRAFPWRPPSP